MSVIIKDIQNGSFAQNAGIKAGDELLMVNGHEIMDVLDYRFYQNDKKLNLNLKNSLGKVYKVKIKKDENDELGLIFDTYLMDKKRCCSNNCIFCFIDQLPKGLRKSLYFKDDDSRLSFLFGNYITLTNITEHEIERIINMHISPVNISVHTTNPELRVKMMNNKNAGDVLKIIDRFNSAGIKMNSQLVLCSGYNDGDELKRTLFDLTRLENMQCIAAVPVGLTKYRENLTPLKPFSNENAQQVIDIIDSYGDFCFEKYGTRRVYASDEFYILANREIPSAEFYGDFMQLENGVGLWALLKSECEEALSQIEPQKGVKRQVSLTTGVSAYPLIRYICDLCEEKFEGLKCDVYKIENNFFGQLITVSGLITATDIIEQLSGKNLGEELLIPSSMLRSEGDMFLDSITTKELSKTLNSKITVTENDGYCLVNAILGIKESV